MSLLIGDRCKACGDKVTVEISRRNEECPYRIPLCIHPFDVRREFCKCYSYTERDCRCASCLHKAGDCAITAYHKENGYR